MLLKIHLICEMKMFSPAFPRHHLLHGHPVTPRARITSRLGDKTLHGWGLNTGHHGAERRSGVETMKA